MLNSSEYTLEITNGLDAVGIREGDNVFLHASLLKLFFMTEIGKSDLHSLVYESIRSKLGSSGAIAMLAATWMESNSGFDFHVDSTPCSKDLGSFAEYLRCHPLSKRTGHPLLSLVFNGKPEDVEVYTKELHCYSYGFSSPWQKMVINDWHIVFLDFDELETMTFIHHIEMVNGVPYLYNKIFQGNVYFEGGNLVGNREYYAYLPYRNISVKYNKLRRLKELLQTEGKIEEVKLWGEINLMSVRFRDVLECGCRLLLEDPYVFLEEIPAYSEKAYPVV